MKQIFKIQPTKRITPDDGQYFFGYYDLQPYSLDGTLHLSHKASFRNKLQDKNDSTEVGFIELSSGKYEKLDTTFAWNFQQGAMLQWNPLSPNDEVIYNSLIDGEHHGVIENIKTGNKRYLDRPVANVSRDGKYALSINMSRLYNFRPGYGYASPVDPFISENHSTYDGVFLIDMITGKSNLVLSLQQLWEFTGSFFENDQKMIINHITFNPDASRFIMLIRNFPEKGKRHLTALVTANRDGSDLYLLANYGVHSHYWWVNNEEIIFANRWEGIESDFNTFLLRDKTRDGHIIADGHFWYDNHMSISPKNANVMLTDSYPHPDVNMLKKLTICDFKKNICADIGHFLELENVCTDVRCDLHPRWNREGTKVSFDSVHEGFRGIYEIDLDEDVLKTLFDKQKR